MPKTTKIIFGSFDIENLLITLNPNLNWKLSITSWLFTTQTIITFSS